MQCGGSSRHSSLRLDGGSTSTASAAAGCAGLRLATPTVQRPGAEDSRGRRHVLVVSAAPPAQGTEPSRWSSCACMHRCSAAATILPALRVSSASRSTLLSVHTDTRLVAAAPQLLLYPLAQTEGSRYAGDSWSARVRARASACAFACACAPRPLRARRGILPLAQTEGSRHACLRARACACVCVKGLGACACACACAFVWARARNVNTSPRSGHRAQVNVHAHTVTYTHTYARHKIQACQDICRHHARTRALPLKPTDEYIPESGEQVKCLYVSYTHMHVNT